MNNIVLYFLSGILFAAATLNCAGEALAQGNNAEPHAFLQKYLGFTSSELAALDRGKVVSKIPQTADRSDVATLGVTRLSVPTEVFLEKFRDIVSFKRSAYVLQIGKFSTVPSLEDLQGLTFDENDFRDLRWCRVGACDLKLPADTINRLLKEINWSSPQARQQVDALLRQTIMNYVNAYLRGGHTALSDYHDSSSPVRPANEFRALLNQSPYLSDYAPEFYRYLAEYPRTRLPGSEDFIYWSKEKFGYKPVITLYHVTIYKHRLGNAESVMIASRQIFATHYYEASLGLTILANRPGDPGAYFLYLNRTRINALRGWAGRLMRPFLQRELLSSTEKLLGQLRQRLESGK